MEVRSAAPSAGSSVKLRFFTRPCFEEGAPRFSYTALALALNILAGSALSQDIPSYQARHAVDTITIDGHLDEFSWQIAPRVGRFRNILSPQRDGILPTQAAIVWSDRKLYVAFVCEDPRPWSTLFDRDSFLWNEEVVEVFLDPDGDGRDYPELEVSPNNVVVDLLIPEPPTPGTDPAIAARWDIKGLRTAVQKHSAGWPVEIAIPWSALADGGATKPPSFGDVWRVGLCRIERPGGDGSDQDPQFQAWSVTEKSFHEPSRFGRVEFIQGR